MVIIEALTTAEFKVRPTHDLEVDETWWFSKLGPGQNFMSWLMLRATTKGSWVVALYSTTDADGERGALVKAHEVASRDEALPLVEEWKAELVAA